MHDVLVHYLEVNFAEIAEQMAHAQPGAQASDQGAAAERLRHLIRRLRGGTILTPTGEHPPEQAAAELTAALNGELTPPEHQVLEHFFELFARSMARTQPQPTPEPEPELEPARRSPSWRRKRGRRPRRATGAGIHKGGGGDF